MENQKRCSLCKKILPSTEFNTNPYRCKSCCKIYHRAYYESHKNGDRQRRWAFQATHPDEVRNAWLKRIYGITLEEYNRQLKRQRGLCAICQGTNNGKTLHVDHDHKTKRMRGLLCRLCNLGLGDFKDNVELLRKAMWYLAHLR